MCLQGDLKSQCQGLHGGSISWAGEALAPYSLTPGAPATALQPVGKPLYLPSGTEPHPSGRLRWAAPGPLPSDTRR